MVNTLFYRMTEIPFDTARTQSAYQSAQVCELSSSGRRCGSLSHQEAGMSL